MNIIESFVVYLEASGFGTYEKNIFIARAPASNTFDKDGEQIPQNIWWLKPGGAGGRRDKFFVHPIEIYYRDRNPKTVYDRLHQLGEDLGCSNCVTLDGFDVVSVEVTGLFTDQDIDAEERTVGLLQGNVITYKKGC